VARVPGVRGFAASSPVRPAFAPVFAEFPSIAEFAGWFPAGRVPALGVSTDKHLQRPGLCSRDPAADGRIEHTDSPGLGSLGEKLPRGR
jgi:hypothetical protein